MNASAIRYDVVVVGAGSAGCVLATRLSEDRDRSVLLVEAGPDYPDYDALPDDLKLGNNPWLSAYGPHNWGFVAMLGPDQVNFPIPRGKVTGGSSAINGQIFARGVPEDYDDWSRQGNDEWSYTNLLPYFRKSEHDLDFQSEFHGSNGPIPVARYKPAEWLPHSAAFVEACLAAGFQEAPDHNQPDSTGISPKALNASHGLRISTALAYLAQARQRPNLTIRDRTMACGLIVRAGRATAIELETRGTREIVETGEIVLSAGAIGSPHLLLCSGIGPVAHLESMDVPVVHDLPGVGQNLQDHPTATVLFEMAGERPDVQAPTVQVGLRYTVEDSHLRNDMQINPFLMTSEHRPLQVAISDTANYVGLGCALQFAFSAGELRLASRDPFVQPLLNYRSLSEATDRDRLRQAVRLAVNLAADTAWADIIVDRIAPTDIDLASDEALNKWLAQNVGTAHHISCTCKMGSTSDVMAVVNQYGEVHGIEGLRIADASIMPSCVRANTNATIIMIGERIADFMIDHH